MMARKEARPVVAPPARASRPTWLAVSKPSPNSSPSGYSC
jgi:hypothetical protein